MGTEGLDAAYVNAQIAGRLRLSLIEGINSPNTDPHQMRMLKARLVRVLGLSDHDIACGTDRTRQIIKPKKPRIVRRDVS